MSRATGGSWRACRSCVVGGLERRRCPRAAGLGDPRAAGRAGARPDRRRDARQPARAARAAPGADAGGARGRVRAPRRGAAGEPDRAELPAAARVASRPRRGACCSIAAAEPVGDVRLLWRAAERLGIGADAAAPAQRLRADRARRPGAVPSSARALGGLPGGVRWPSARRSIGRWPRRPIRDVDPDRRAWHRAHAAAGPDEDVADELERSADRAQARGGLAAAAAFLERATELTPDPARRGRAGAGRRAGQVRGRRARRRARAARDRGDRPARRASARAAGAAARADRVRRAGAAATLRRCCSTPPSASSRSTPRWRARRISKRSRRRSSPAASAARRGVREVAEAARAAPPAPTPPRAIDLLLDGLATRFTEGYAAGRAAAQASAPRVLRRGRSRRGRHRWLWLACRIAQRSLGRRDVARWPRARSPSRATPAR